VKKRVKEPKIGPEGGEEVNRPLAHDKRRLSKKRGLKVVSLLKFRGKNKHVHKRKFLKKKKRRQEQCEN